MDKHMRQVLSVSLPGQTIQKIRQKTKQRGFNNVSNYIRYLIEEDDDLISADEILKAAKEAEEEYKQGKAIKAKSIADLL